MQIHISPRHIQLTAAIHAHVAGKVAHLEEYTDSILAAHVVLLFDEHRSKKKDFLVKIHLALPGPDLHAEDAEDDLYSAIDLTVKKLVQQLRKRKTKVKEKAKHKVKVAKEIERHGYRR
ncbi:MAG: ribosome-associated translation inhibitor RaiA [Verrucomicrobiota bacterium]|jgi:putative sigma-54 modulation protein